MATVTATVKEALVGSTRDPQVSDQTRATFDRNSRQDEQTKEWYMTQEGFIKAVAPDDEDYVSRLNWPITHQRVSRPQLGWRARFDVMDGIMDS